MRREHIRNAAVLPRSLERRLREAGGSPPQCIGLCHGLTGNAEVLVYGRQALGTEWADSSALAYEVANAGIETCVARGLPWPCGTGIGGETPNLMLGLAGIGHFYLRLHDPTIPSVLMLRREDFSSNESKGVM